MGKPTSSSASLKKKRSKASSKIRIKKTSKTKKRSKSKRSSRRRHDSDSYSSDYDSLISSTASSEEDYWRRSKKRARSPSKKSSRRSKKRSRGQSYSAESSEELPSRKKRKGSKRDGKLSPRMKRSRRKSKRCVSSASSGSYCSTCAESSSDSGRSESQSYRASSERKESKDKDRWTVEKGKTEVTGCGYSPRSYYPISHRSIGSGDESDEKMRGGNNSMRLRSVIMVNNEDRELHAYGHKEEITYETDDYPSCKSNDSNDSGGKRELTHHPLVESEVKRQVDDEKDEAVVSDMNTTAITEDSQKDGNNMSSIIVGTIHAIRDNESNVSGGSDGNDLESILRQRALENLKKFRGAHKKTAALSAQEENVDGTKKQSLIATSESSDHKFPEDNVANAPPVEVNVANSDSSVKRDIISVNSNDASLGDKGGKVVPAIWRQSSEVRLDHEHSGFKESVSTRQSVVKQLHKGTSVANAKQEVIPTFASNTSNPRVTSYTWRRESAKVQAPSKELRPNSGPPQAKLVVTKGIGGKSTIEAVGIENKVDDNEVHQKHASSAPELPSHSESTSGAVSSDKDGNDAKDGPQYEQKTMSVTRGGETIKVNYQVYIPKRAPALARRQLKR